MIKSKEGTIEFYGSVAEILADLSSIVHTLYFNVMIGKNGAKPEYARAKIMDAFEHGFCTKEELDIEIECLHDSIEKIIDALGEFVKKAGEL